MNSTVYRDHTDARQARNGYSLLLRYSAKTGRTRGNGIMHRIIIMTGILVSLTLGGCMSAAQHREAVRDDSSDRITVGVVQKEVRIGMSGAEIIEILGSPNIVSTDSSRREVWVYDKIATEYAYSTSGGGASAFVLGFDSDVLNGVNGGYNRNAGAASRSQRTLTIIVKFDQQSLVRDFAYHSSSF